MSILKDDPRLTQFNLKPTYFQELLSMYQEHMEYIFERKVKSNNVAHAQK
jgi:hypothetical protein